ncbi:MAG: hypothetical protein AAGC69_12355 [Paracraurococcus sp.]|jgi:rubrerythrin
MSDAPDRCPACRAELTDRAGSPALRHLAPAARRSRARSLRDAAGDPVWECPDCGHHWDRHGSRGESQPAPQREPRH